jgi:hypothetical protein
MKKMILFCLAVVFVAGINSCGKDSSNTDVVIYKVPVDIAARYIALAFCNASAGINSHMENAAGFTARGSETFDSTFNVKVTDSNAVVRYNYNVVYNFIRQAANPPNTTMGYTSQGTFSSNAMISQDSPKGNWILTTLDQALLTMNGNGEDAGMQYAKLEKVNFGSKITYTLNNVMMSKVSPYMAASGTAQVSINGTGPLGVLFGYSGTITYNGNRQATLVLGGVTFHFSLSSGAITS